VTERKPLELLKPLEPLTIDERLDAADVFGKIREDVHFAGYAVERGLAALEWMLDDERRWRSLRQPFNTVHEFIDSIGFDKELRIVAERRQKIARRLKEFEPDISNIEIAKTLGVNRKTIDRDLGTNVPLDSQKIQENQSATGTHVHSSPPPTAGLSGADVAKLAARRETTARSRQARDDARQNALYSGGEIAPGIALHVGDFRELSLVIPDASVELIFTDPPYDRESIPLYGTAAKEAARILKPGGSMITYCGHFAIDEVIPLMKEHLKYYCIGADVHTGQLARLNEYGIIVGSKPLLWFVKEYRGDRQTFVNNTVISRPEKDTHDWQQPVVTAEHFIKHLTSEGGTVVDFFVGGGTTLVAAKRLGRRAIGFEIDPETAAKAKERLEAEEAPIAPADAEATS
jgi:16S rRNA G966 N2-methylase RsmD